MMIESIGYKMGDFSFIIRNYQPADFDKLVRFLIEVEKLELRGRGVYPQVIVEHLGQPNYSAEQDLFLAELAGDIIGYMDVTPELAIGRVILHGGVHPEHRRKGVGTKLFSHTLRRAQELGGKVAHVNIMEDNLIARVVLSRFGFQPVRRFLHLRVDMSKLPGEDIDEAPPDCRHLRCGEEEILTQIQNRSFVGTWGYNPSTVEAITYRTHLSNCSPEDVVLAYEGDRITGYCWTRITGDRELAGGERKGQIFMLGTDPSYRGRGVGRRALLAGLAYLKGKWLPVTELTVDSENKVAYHLYRSIGFEVWTSSLWYEKVINQQTGAK